MDRQECWQPKSCDPTPCRIRCVHNVEITKPTASLPVTFLSTLKLIPHFIAFTPSSVALSTEHYNAMSTTVQFYGNLGTIFRFPSHAWRKFRTYNCNFQCHL